MSTILGRTLAVAHSNPPAKGSAPYSTTHMIYPESSARIGHSSKLQLTPRSVSTKNTNAVNGSSAKLTNDQFRAKFLGTNTK